jgi:hypothetical protein
MSCDQWLKNVPPMGLERDQCSGFIRLYQTAVTDDIGNQYGCEATFHNAGSLSEED